jgi:PAS domain S-box-containing protein
MLTTVNSQITVCLRLTKAISRARSLDDIYGAALDALGEGLGIDRASILLFDADGVMRFKAWRGLSPEYRQAVEGHTPWAPDSPEPDPVTVDDIRREPSLASFMPDLEREGIASLAFVPLVSRDRVIGKFMVYHGAPHAFSREELQLAGLVAGQVAFAVERTRAEAQARRSEERLRFALDAAAMGTWDWDLTTNHVEWSPNLERIHGLPGGTFDGTFASYEREIHPDDRARVLASSRRALAEGVPHDVEYRIVAPDGTERWCEGKGRVEYDNGRPVRMTGVCMMVTRRKEAELARLAAAEEASRLKDEFLATLSHELRTPLNAILGWVQLLRNGAVGPEREGQALDVIGRNAMLQRQLIDDILDVSRIITGKLALDCEPVSVSQLVETVVSGVTPAAQARKIEVTRAVDHDLPPLDGDPRRLHQVLGNVLSNAVKFTPDGGRVDIDARQEGDALCIRVRDTGVGILPEFLPFVFDRFRQADSGPARRHGGLGLGLAIARHLVELHGGGIRAESAGPGTGTTVTVTLPCAAPPETRLPAPALDASRAADVRLDGMAVVVVDDQADSRELLAVMFEDHGARVTRCASASAALEALAARPAQLLVADIGMPDVDGHELLRRLGAGGSMPRAIAVSAYAHPEDRHRAMSVGFLAYCAKPVDEGELFATVRRILPLAGGREERESPGH